MNFFSDSLVYFIKKPLIPIYVATVTLVYSILMIFNPLKSLINFLDFTITDDLGTSIVIFSKSFYTFKYLPYFLLGILGVSVILALFSSLIYSGFMNIVHLTVKRIKTNFSDYLQGLKKGFFKSTLVFFQFYLTILLIVGFLPLALTPFYILRDSVLESGNDPLILYLFLAIIILVIVSLAVIIYMKFMFKFPSIFYFSRYPIEKANSAVNARYWRTFGKVFILLLLLVGIEFVMFQITNKALEFLVGFVLYTVYFSFFAVFPFYTFDKLVEPYKLND